MFEQRYRQRLDGDLLRWQAAGIIPAGTSDAIRLALGPPPKGIDLASVVAIVGGLLIAAAFLAFVAANWAAIPRPARFAILLAGIAGAYGLGAWFDRAGRTIIADLCATAGSIIFGAAIALVGQMYHLAGDFAGGMAFWAIGALAAAALTGSRGALAVSLVVGCIWSGSRAFDENLVPHLPFVALWVAGVGLAFLWNAPVARHLVAAAGVAWWIETAFGFADRFSHTNPAFIAAAGAALFLGIGIALASRGPETLRAFGLTLSTYGAFVLALALALNIAGAPGSSALNLPHWSIACGVVGAVSALAAAAITRSLGPPLASLSIALSLVAMAMYSRPDAINEPWLSYALALAAMLSLTVSGILDEIRPRVVAGWIGLGAVIAAITWAVKGSLLKRALFLAIAGGIAVAFATVLGRKRKEQAS